MVDAILYLLEYMIELFDIDSSDSGSDITDDDVGGEQHEPVASHASEGIQLLQSVLTNAHTLPTHPLVVHGVARYARRRQSMHSSRHLANKRCCGGQVPPVTERSARAARRDVHPSVARSLPRSPLCVVVCDRVARAAEQLREHQVRAPVTSTRVATTGTATHNIVDGLLLDCALCPLCSKYTDISERSELLHALRTLSTAAPLPGVLVAARGDVLEATFHIMDGVSNAGTSRYRQYSR